MNPPAPPALDKAHPGTLPQPLTTVCAGLAGLGVVAFVVGLLTDSETAWRAFHVNFLFFAGLAQGGLVLSCAFVIIGAHWPGPVRRIAEGLAAWVPVSLVLSAVSFFGREAIYTTWIHHPPAGKEAWLNIPRVYITDLTVLAVLAVLTVVYLKASARPTLEGVAEHAQSAKGMFERWTAGWRGYETERAASERRLKILAPIIAMAYVVGFTVISFDQVMSLTPTWFSNLFGWYFAWGGFLSAVAATALISVLLRRSEPMEGQITPARMHDLGKMLFAFSIFWMYLFFAQYIVIWYGNLPEETQFLQSRLGSQFLQDTTYWVASRLREPYARLTLTAWLCCWIVPFWVLLGQRPKRTPAILGSVAAIVLLGFWIERNVLVWPSLVPANEMAWLGPIQIGVALGFLGAFVLVYLAYTRIFPSLAVPRQG